MTAKECADKLTATFGPRWSFVHEAAALILSQEQEIEALRAERDAARASVGRSVELLIGIQSLMYPPPMETADGRTMVFRPKNVDPHEVLQKLSDRIRALSGEAAIGAAKGRCP